jgi:hypothetical protein
MSWQFKRTAEQRRARWQAIRSRGPARFILLRGVLGFGSVFTIVHSVLAYFDARTVRHVMGQAFPGSPDPVHAFLIRVVPLQIVISLAGGFLVGAIVWLIEDWLFRRSAPHAAP